MNYPLRTDAPPSLSPSPDQFQQSQPTSNLASLHLIQDTFPEKTHSSHVSLENSQIV